LQSIVNYGQERQCSESPEASFGPWQALQTVPWCYAACLDCRTDR